jgi:hypothetical protein
MRHLPVKLLATIKSKNLALAILLFLPLITIVGNASADTIAKTFASNQTISPGYVVAISKADTTRVELATEKELSRIYGVAVDPSDSSVTLQSANGKVVVVTSGSYNLLVSLSGGVVKAGDYLSLSPTDGISAKASDSQEYIVGRALSDFNGTTGVISGNGDNAVGRIAAQVSPGKNPLSKSEPTVPGPLLKVANSLAGKPVSAERVYTALGIFLVSLAVAASLIYVGVRSSMISIGRNPLSKHSIMRGLMQVVFAAALVFSAGLLGVYLLVRV